MRTHQEIIKAYGATNLLRDLPSVGVRVAQSTPQRWADRDSIPPEYWNAIVSLKLATLDELAGASAARLRQGAAA